VGSGALHIRLLDPDRRDEAARVVTETLGAEVHQEPDPSALSVSCADADRAAEAVGALSRAEIAVANFSLGQPSLDEVFMALTGHPAEEAPEEDVAVEEEQAA
jgi:ABC-2 type transport system ATP-binding protein